MIIPALLRAVGWAIGAVQAATELVGAGKRVARQVRQGLVPLSHKDSERIAEFGRRAGHESQTLLKPRR